MGEVMLHFFINPKCLFNNVIVLFYSLDSWRKCKIIYVLGTHRVAEPATVRGKFGPFDMATFVYGSGINLQEKLFCVCHK